MRIIGGKLKGLRLNPPTSLPVRPTTDMAKEALFNILINRIDFDEINVLDLFSGTGSISIEFASRGASTVVSVDLNFGCVQYLKNTAKQHGLDVIKAIKADAFKYLKNENQKHDLIFADAPYDHPQLTKIPELVFQKEILKPSGLLIVEHPSTIQLNYYPQFIEQRKYGYSSFSFFNHPG